MTDRLDGPADTFDWRPIEHEARMHALSVLERDESTPLVFGAHIAWVEFVFGRTDALTPVHRVGYPIAGKPYTTCHEGIPGPLHWMVLSPALIESLGPCRFCEAEYQRSEQWNDSAA